MVLYSLKELQPPSQYPDELLDINVRTDYGRIQRLLFTPEGEVREAVAASFQTVITEGWIDAEPASSFPLDRAHEGGYFVSLLYYLGLLTHQWDAGWLRLGIPNYAIRLLYWEAIGRLLHDLHHVDVDVAHVRTAQRAMALGGPRTRGWIVSPGRPSAIGRAAHAATFASGATTSTHAGQPFRRARVTVRYTGHTLFLSGSSPSCTSRTIANTTSLPCLTSMTRSARSSMGTSWSSAASTTATEVCSGRGK